MESKWADAPYESKKTPDLDQMDLEQYQVKQLNYEISLVCDKCNWASLAAGSHPFDCVVRSFLILNRVPIQISLIEANHYENER